ncbi:MAG: Mur ligase domain-containing protein, partial [Deltaproteobacteria bacterium]|nr:Mur ligase domain-containing protein [Deltaproteobacteria bacterium]
MTWEALTRAVGGARSGTEAGPRLVIDGVSTDNRNLLPGQVFFCIRGENFDGHDFAASAVERGAAAVVADRDLALPAPVLRVDDEGKLVKQTQVRGRKASLAARMRRAFACWGHGSAMGKTSATLCTR